VCAIHALVTMLGDLPGVVLGHERLIDLVVEAYQDGHMTKQTSDRS